MTDHIVLDVLAEYNLEPADFDYGGGERLNCPSCLRQFRISSGLMMHHTKMHGSSARAAVCGGTEQYRAILESLHCKHELSPPEIANPFPETVGDHGIREDCKSFAIYRTHPTSPAGGAAATLEEMTVEEFDAALAGDSA